MSCKSFQAKALAASFFLSTMAFAAESTSSFENRLGIINGDNVDDAEGIAKSIVKMELVGVGKCSGQLIAPDIVLTASHCVMAGIGGPGTVITSNANRGQDCSMSTGDKVDYVPGSIIDDDGESRLPDIAVVKLKSPICGTTSAKFAPDVAPKAGEKTLVAGYGLGTKYKDRADRIELTFLGDKKSVVDLYQDADDPKWTQSISSLFDDASKYYTFLVPTKEQTSLCFGDSGGPAYVVRNQEVFVMGVNGAIVGHPKRGVPQCNRAYLNLITPVQPYLDWLNYKLVEWAQKS